MTQGDPHIGKSIPRPNARRLLQGKGRFLADKVLPRMLHAAFVRWPHAHARILHIDLSAARAVPGVVAKHLGLSGSQVRVIAEDVGGSFGIKIHTFGEEIATAVVAELLRRPVQFAADRYGSFLSDIHARDHHVWASAAIDEAGCLTALEIDDLTGIGPYSVYPRSSAIEGNQVLNLTGAIAGAILQCDPETLDLAGGAVVDAQGQARITLQALAQMVYYRGNELPPGLATELVATPHFRVERMAVVFPNGALASYVAVDAETGMIRGPDQPDADDARTHPACAGHHPRPIA